jgi:NAD+ kinase
MTQAAGPLKVILLANRQKPAVVAALTTFRPWLASRVQLLAEPDITTLTREQANTLPKADLILVLGGDGTILAQARHMVDMGAPMLGVNFGKLGFLAEFSLDDVHKHWALIEKRDLRISQRLMIQTTVYDRPARAKRVMRYQDIALNDAVITAGAPFRTIDLALMFDPEKYDGSHATTFTSDGVIVSTPSGSTAYNLSAGGPIVSSDLNALVITAMCPHSLAFRPLVVDAGCEVVLRLDRCNAGTTLVIDGQLSHPLAAGQEVVIQRYVRPLLLAQNPELNYWKMLAKKLHWAAKPRG